MTRLVAVEPASGDRIRLYQRQADDTVTAEVVPFHPWLVTAAAPAWPDLADQLNVRELAGDQPLRYLVRCATWSVFQTVRERAQAANLAALTLGSPVEQYLLMTGRTLFKAMRFDELLRLQFDIETVGLDPRVPDGRVLMIALTTNRGLAETIGAPGDDEAALLQAFTVALRRIDPDIIEGHNIFNFDLTYLVVRAARHGVRLGWGRDGSTPRLRTNDGTEATAGGPRVKVGARAIPYTDCRIYGRHVIDTYHQVQRYDSAGNLEQYGLKEVTEALGLTRPGRTFLPGATIAGRWLEAPEEVRRYALDDVRDVEQLAAVTLPTEFYQTQIVPWSLQSVATRGTGEKIDDLLVRAYLAAGQSLPLPQPPRPTPGGYGEVRAIGIFRPVAKADVESLYPAIMLTQQIAPASDRLGYFLPLLEELTRQRLDAKRLARQTAGAEQAYWQGIQSSFKVLINSFYGYLGYNRAAFSDFDAAERVTLAGQAIIKQVMAELERTKARVIEVDTDGVYFVPPPFVDDSAAVEAYIGSLAALLPAGINLAFDGYFAGMISLKLKNYILMTPEGSMILRGSSVRSRREELFTRRFVREAARLLITADQAAVRELYLVTADQLQRRALPPSDIVRVENITDKTFSSEATRRLARAAGGASIGDRVAVYQRRDGSLARLEEYVQDEDIDYLLRRLRDMAGRFADLFADAQEFDYCFPPLTARTDLAAVRQAKPMRQLPLF